MSTVRTTTDILNSEEVRNLPTSALPRVVYKEALGSGSFSEQTTILRDLLRDVTRNVSLGFGHGIYKFGQVGPTVPGRGTKAKHGRCMRFGCQQCLRALDAAKEDGQAFDKKIWQVIYECSSEGNFVLVSQSSNHIPHAFFNSAEEILAGAFGCLRTCVFC